MAINGEMLRLEVKEKTIEALSEEDLEEVVSNTRRIAAIMIKSGREDELDLEHLFERQIELQGDRRLRREEFERYEAVMERLGGNGDILSPRDYMNRSRTANGKDAELKQRIDHILEQGWEKGTLISPIKGGSPKAIICISRNGKILLQDKNGNHNPLHYKTYKPKS